MDTEIAKEFTLIHSRLDEHDQKFVDIDRRFDQVDERFDRMDERFDRMDERFDRMDERFERMDRRLDRMDERMDNLVDELLGELKGYFEILREDMRNDNRVFLESLNSHGTRLDNHETRIRKLEKKRSA